MWLLLVVSLACPLRFPSNACFNGCFAYSGTTQSHHTEQQHRPYRTFAQVQLTNLLMQLTNLLMQLPDAPFDFSPQAKHLSDTKTLYDTTTQEITRHAEERCTMSEQRRAHCAAQVVQLQTELDRVKQEQVRVKSTGT